jgi:nitrogen regulatory protein P-II 1
MGHTPGKRLLFKEITSIRFRHFSFGMQLAYKQVKENHMIKKLEAFIREDALDAVKDALRAIGIVGMNIHSVRGSGRQADIQLSWRGASYQIDLLPKMQVNIILSAHNVEKAVEAITKAARTGKEGDGLIFIYPVEDVVRIRTGERGREALMYQDDIDVRRGEKSPK